MANKKKSKEAPTWETCNLFITITAHPKIYDNVSRVQYQLTKPVVLECMTHLKFNGTMYAELTEANNIHFHGLGSFLIPKRVKHARRWLMDWWKEHVIQRQVKEKYYILGHIRIELPRNENHINDYNMKDEEEIKEVLSVPTTKVWHDKEPYLWFNELDKMAQEEAHMDEYIKQNVINNE